MRQRLRRLLTRMWDTPCQISRFALAPLISKPMLETISAGSSGRIRLFTRVYRRLVIPCNLQDRGSAIGLSITGKPRDVLSSRNRTAASASFEPAGGLLFAISPDGRERPVAAYAPVPGRRLSQGLDRVITLYGALSERWPAPSLADLETRAVQLDHDPACQSLDIAPGVLLDGCDNHGHDLRLALPIGHS